MEPASEADKLFERLPEAARESAIDASCPDGVFPLCNTW